MKKNFKRNLLASLAVVALGAGVAGVTNVNASANEEVKPDLYVAGASVRLDNQAGLRFTVLVKSSVYETALQSATAKTGVFVIPSDQLEDVGTEGWDLGDFVNAQDAVTADASAGTTEWFVSPLEDGYMQSSVFLYDIPAASYNRPISAVAYATVDGTNYVFSEVVERSIAGVAYESKEKGYVTPESVATYLSQEYTVTFIDEKGEELSSETYTYGEEFVLPGDYVVDSNTELFDGWKKRVGTNNSEAVWADEVYDFTATNAKKVSGNIQFKVNTKSAYIFNSFDTAKAHITGDGVTETWLESYNGEQGVVKAELPNANQMFAITGLDSTVMDKAVANKFDYISLRVYLDAGENNSAHYYIRNFNSQFGEIFAGKWMDFHIDVNEWSNTHVSGNGVGFTPAQGRAHMQTFAGDEWATVGYIQGATAGCTLYFSEIAWGNYSEGAGDNYFYTFSAEDSMVLPSDNASFSGYPNTDPINDPAWFATYQGANGVMRLPLSSSGNYNLGINYLRLYLGKGAMKAAVEAEFDYIRFRVYIDPVGNRSTRYMFANKNASFGWFEPNQWITVDIRLDKLASTVWMGDLDKTATTVEDTRALLASQWGEAVSYIFAVDHDYDGNIDLYIDNISWGVDA